MWLGWATRFTLCRTLTWGEDGLSGHARFSPVLFQPSEAHLFTPAPSPPSHPLSCQFVPGARVPCSLGAPLASPAQ